MFRNYLKTTARTLIRNKGYTVINILGLAIGLSASILILLFIISELSYDDFHNDPERIYRIAVKGRMSGDFFDVAVTPAPLAPALARTYPEVTSSTRLKEWSQQALISYDDKNFYEKRILYADSTFFEIFNFTPLLGDLKKSLTEPFSVVLTRPVAEKYFGDKNPVGEMIRVNDTYNFKITAVIDELPANTHLKFTILFSWSTIEKMGDNDLDKQWGALGYYTYIKLVSTDVAGDFEKKIKSFIIDNMKAQFDGNAEDFDKVQLEFTPYLQPLTDIHLHSNLMAELSPNSDIAYVKAFAAIAIIIILIACINFMNLSTARSAKRAKEVGIRKVHGSVRSQLIFQFIGESMAFSFLALIVAVVIVELIMPAFSGFIGQQLNETLLTSPVMILWYLLIAIIVGVIAGSYPAFYLSSFQPVHVLKGNAVKGPKNPALRNILVVMQFSVSIFLIIGTGIIYQQLEFVKNKKLGFEKENVIVIQLQNDRLREKSSYLENELKKLSVVKNVGASNAAIGQGTDGTGYFPEGESATDPWLIFNLGADYNYIATLGMEIIRGRNFSKEYASDTAGVLINETLMNKLGWGDNPIGRKLRPGDPENKFAFHVIGVIRDFHFTTLHDKIEPLLIYLSKTKNSNLYIRIHPGEINLAIQAISNRWNSLEPAFPFEYSFLDKAFNELYLSEQRLAKLFTYFSLIAILIACLGLFGLASFNAEQRTKEIGIRKIFGASTGRMATLLIRDLTRWILIANIIAWPLGYYFMERWLQDFAFRIEIHDHWYIFFIAAFASFAIAILTVAFQAVKVAGSNPVNSIKYE